MKHYPITFPSLLGITLLLLFPFSIGIAAQAVKPDEQIVRQMMDYVTDLQIKAAAGNNSRPRTFSGNAPTVKTAAYRRGGDAVGYKAAAAPTPTSPSALAALERRAFDILNNQRAAKGLSPLRWSEELAGVARLHSGNMARYKFFSHTGRDGLSVNHRARQLGVRSWRGIGENIAFNQGFSKPVEMACQHWMTSPGHRENILNRSYTESGIGVAVAPDGGYYFTQVFLIR